jgi:hypothetical protein
MHIAEVEYVIKAGHTALRLALHQLVVTPPDQIRAHAYSQVEYALKYY